MQNSGFRPNCWCLKFSLCLIWDIAKSPAVSVSGTFLPLIPHTLSWFLLGQLLALYTSGAIYQGEICSGGEDRDSVCSLILNAVFSLRWFKSFCSKNLTSVMHSQPSEVTQDLQHSVVWPLNLEYFCSDDICCCDLGTLLSHPFSLNFVSPHPCMESSRAMKLNSAFHQTLLVKPPQAPKPPSLYSLGYFWTAMCSSQVILEFLLEFLVALWNETWSPGQRMPHKAHAYLGAWVLGMSQPFLWPHTALEWQLWWYCIVLEERDPFSGTWRIQRYLQITARGTFSSFELNANWSRLPLLPHCWVWGQASFSICPLLRNRNSQNRP